MAIVTDPKAWPVDNQEVRMRKGPLVKVQIGPGQYRKMYQSDAERLGLIKAKPPAQNKMRTPEGDKAPTVGSTPASDQPPAPPADDFTTISGVGKATARALAANGITTFEQLRAAGKLDYLSDQVNQAIQEWRDG